MADFAFQTISLYIGVILKVLNPSDFEDFFIFTNHGTSGHVAELAERPANAIDMLGT